MPKTTWFALSSWLLAAVGCTKPNPIWGLEDGQTAGGSMGGSTSAETGAMTSTSTSTTTTTSTTAGLMCQGDFEATFDGTEPFVENGWSIGGGRAVGPACPVPLAIMRLDGADWTDAAFEMTLTIDEECSSPMDMIHGAGLMGRIDDSSGCAGLSTVFCIIDVAQNELYLGIADDACNGPTNPNAHLMPPLAFEYGQTYQMQLLIQGSTAYCRVEDSNGLVTAGEITDDGGIISAMGSVAVYTENAVATVTSLSVCTPA